MNLIHRAALVSGLCGLVCCGAQAADAPAVNLQLIMLTKVNPQGLALWDVTNNAVDDDGKLDPKKLATQWNKLIEIGRALEEGGRTLTTAKTIIAASPGAKLQDETGPGASKAADVQRFIDAKPDLLRKQAAELQKTGADVVEAAKKRDVKKLGESADSLDTVCENCHVNFWYPQQSRK